MESETATDTVLNPCRGSKGIASIEYKPGTGFLQRFHGGDMQATVEAVELVRCTDGRARVMRSDPNTAVCNDFR